MEVGGQGWHGHLMIMHLELVPLPLYNHHIYGTVHGDPVLEDPIGTQSPFNALTQNYPPQAPSCSWSSLWWDPPVLAVPSYILGL